MSARILILSVLVTVLSYALSTPGSLAQSYYGMGYHPYGVSLWPGPYRGYHSSTAVEGYLRGQAAVIQARGVASLYYAEAERNREETRGLYLENRLANLNYHAERRALRSERTERRREELARHRATALRLVAERNAERASLIHWPAELMDERYASLRTEVESLVKLRGQLGADAGEATTLAIRHAIRELAKLVVEDEQSGRLKDEQSQKVRQFVRGLAAKLYGSRAPQDSGNASETRVAGGQNRA